MFYNKNDYRNYLMHYGVKGMKWKKKGAPSRYMNWGPDSTSPRHWQYATAKDHEHPDTPSRRQERMERVVRSYPGRLDDIRENYRSGKNAGNRKTSKSGSSGQTGATRSVPAVTDRTMKRQWTPMTRRLAFAAARADGYNVRDGKKPRKGRR